MTTLNIPDPVAAQPLVYAASDLGRRPRRFLWFGLCSLILGLLGLGLNGLIAFGAWRDAQSTQLELRQLSAIAARSAAPTAAPVPAVLTHPVQLFPPLTGDHSQVVVDAVNRRLKAAGAPPLNPAQQNRLVAALQTPQQRMIDLSLPLPGQPPSKPTVSNQQVFARSGEHPGDVLLTFRRSYAHGPISESRSSFELTSQGQLVDHSSQPAPQPANPYSAAAAPSPSQYGQMLEHQVIAARAAAIVAALFAALGLELFVAGIVLISWGAAGIRLHVWYAVLKLLAVALNATGTICGFGWPSGAFSGSGASFLILLWCLSCIYPIIILILLRRCAGLALPVIPPEGAIASASGQRSGLTASLPPAHPKVDRTRRWRIGIFCASLVVAAVGLVVNWQLLQGVTDDARGSASAAAAQDQAMADRRRGEAAEAIAEQQAQAHPPRGLTADEASEIVRHIQTVTRLTRPQIQTLTDLLQKQGQWLIDPHIAPQTFEERWGLPQHQAPFQLLVPQIMQNGELELEIWHQRVPSEHEVSAQVIIEPDGKLEFMQVDSAAGRDTITATGSGGGHELSYATIPTAGDPYKQMKAHEQASAGGTGVIVARADLALSALLLLAALLMLKLQTAPVAVFLHWLYVAAKLAAALAGAWAFSQMWSNAEPGSLLSPSMQQGLAIVFAMAGAAYPVALAVMLLAMHHAKSSGTQTEGQRGTEIATTESPLG